ncbi:MAG: glycosyltransferase involved in cell wall biosynthesis [Candidatus Promineifilaceae bacterium]|jgi:glycosyltransferase involved in cell wall biosynthesis
MRVIGTLKGDINKFAADKIKYGLMFKELENVVELVSIHPTFLHGLSSLINYAKTFTVNRKEWRERYYKNAFAFKERSKQAAHYLKTRQADYDITFQVGALYNARWNNQGNPSVIYTDYTSYLSRQRKTSGRSPMSDGEFEKWMELEQKAYENSHYILTRSEYVRSSIINHYSIPPNKVKAIGGGVGFDILPEPNTRSAGKTVNVLFIGQSFYRKGADILLEAWSQINHQFPHAKLKMVTQLPDNWNEKIANVEFVDSKWDRAVIEQLYKEADIFVLPSRLETWGDVLLEAMAHGIPCIGVSGEAMGEIVVHEQTGLIVPPERPDMLAKALQKLVTSSDLRHAYGQAGRERLKKHFTWDVVMGQVAAVLETIPISS